MTTVLTSIIERLKMLRIAEITARHQVSAPFKGESSPEKQYNMVREDRAFLLDEIKRLRLRLACLMEWVENYTVPFANDAEFIADIALAKKARDGIPDNT